MKHKRVRETQRRFVVPAAAAGTTLLQGLCAYVRGLSESQARVALEVGCVFVDRRRVSSADWVLEAGQLVLVHLGRPFEQAVLQGATRRPPPKVPREIYEDEHVLVVFKPAGLLTAPTPEGQGADLLTLLRTDARTPLLVHRLDLPTSGLLILAKTTLANRVLSDTFERHDLVRRYDAFVPEGYPLDRETIDAPIEGRRAVSHVEVVTRLPTVTRLRVTLETGRTHQIRRHLRLRGFPVLADSRWGKPTAGDPPRLALHARFLELRHPVTSAVLRFEEDLPEDLAGWLQSLSLAVNPSGD